MATSSPTRFNTLGDQDVRQYIRNHSAALIFPEKLMYLMIQVERTYVGRDELCAAPIGWVRNGTVIVIRDQDELVRQWLPRFFDKSIKLSSFLRKCYRWGFKRLSLTMWELSLTPALPSGNCVYISCEWFQRDDKDLMYNMESTTSVKTRSRRIRQRRRERESLIEAALERTPSHGKHGARKTPSPRRRINSQQGKQIALQSGPGNIARISCLAIEPPPIPAPTTMNGQLQTSQPSASNSSSTGRLPGQQLHMDTRIQPEPCLTHCTFNLVPLMNVSSTPFTAVSSSFTPHCSQVGVACILDHVQNKSIAFR